MSRGAIRSVVASVSVLGFATALDTPPAAAQTPQLEEIVVTAQRREQNLQDVGISVTALGASTLEDLNINTATDIVRAVPSLKMNAYSSAQVVFNIRGVSQNDYGDQQEPPVAVYQDDSYASTINLASFPIFDLQRVEVLRGPQGTLFGRNATGGAIQFVSNKPTREPEGYVSTTLGSFSQWLVEGAVSGPLSDNVQGRLAGIRNKDDGYIRSVIDGEDDRGGNDHYALRGQLAWQPNDASDVNLIVRYMEADRETQAGLYSHEPACPNAQYQGRFLPPDKLCAFWGQVPGDEGESGTGYRNDKIIPSRGGDPWATAETEESYVDREIWGATLHYNVDIGELHLVSITDYQDGEKFYIEGGDSSPDDGVFFYQGSDLEQASQEFRLSGLYCDHQWVAGLYGMFMNGNYTGKFADPFYGYDPTVEMGQQTTSWATFAQDEWQFDEAWKLTLGLRYWNDQREGKYYGRAPAVPGLSAPVKIVFDQHTVSPAGSAVTPSDADVEFDDVTARVQLDWTPTDSMLWYLGFNRGSKSGGFTFSTGTPYDPDGTQTIPRAFLEGLSFEPEVLDAYELGVKTRLGDSATLNMALFYYDYSDYQAFTQYGPIQTVLNMEAEETGFEAELSAHPLEGLTLQLGVSLLDSEVSDVTLPDTVTVEDHDLPQAPDVSGNALVRYEFGLAEGTVGLQADAQYSDGFCFTVLCAPVELEGGYTVANARISYDSGDGSWGIAGFVNNVFEEEYRVYAFDSSLFSGVVAGVYAKPRVWGVTATYRFGEN